MWTRKWGWDRGKGEWEVEQKRGKEGIENMRKWLVAGYSKPSKGHIRIFPLCVESTQ